MFPAGRNIDPTHGGRAAVPIRERKVTTFRAIEYIVFVDGSLRESELFDTGTGLNIPKPSRRGSSSLPMAVGNW